MAHAGIILTLNLYAHASETGAYMEMRKVDSY